MNKFKTINKNTVSGILFLRGVYKKDCKSFEDIFQDRLMHDEFPESETKCIKVYDEIPIKFTSLESWKKKSNNKCWRCHRNFETRPWFEPQSIEPVSHGKVGNFIPKKSMKKVNDERNVSIVARGNFCSPNCVCANIHLHTKTLEERLNKIDMLKYVYEIFTGRAITDIQPSPNPTIMKAYNGIGITENEYQNLIDNLDAEYSADANDNDFNNMYHLYITQISS